MITNTAKQFKQNSNKAINDPKLQRSLHKLEAGLQAKRRKAVAQRNDFEMLREHGEYVRKNAVAHLPQYLELFEKNVHATGGHVHWAETAEQAQQIVLDICKNVSAKRVAKGKSMATEEIALNDFLAAEGITTTETDLGEYILQLRNENPSHIVVPAFHLDREAISDTFKSSHIDRDGDRDLGTPQSLVKEARSEMQKKFQNADVGITGANFLVADTGSSVIVTNEGNGDICQTLPDVHIVVAGIDKIVKSLDDTATLLRLLSRSATGQDATAYVTFSTGVRTEQNLDGPNQFHVILLDNGRSSLVGTENESVLQCIRCGACMNHCPVYGAVGGHAYGWVYPGPIGSALNPGLLDIASTHELPNASTFCGRCDEVCPVKIPLTSIMRNWRAKAYSSGITAVHERLFLKLWLFFTTRPRLFHALTALAIPLMQWSGGKKGHFKNLPYISGWTQDRNLPAPEGKTFYALTKKRRKAEK